jgi:hypothetical protein
MSWLTLILSLPTENATARMRAWRGLKACGAAVLRDGVYLLPARDECRATLAGIAEDVRDNGGTAFLLATDGEETNGFAALFDRSAEFGALLEDIARSGASLSADTALDTLKQARKLRRAFAQLMTIDFFPGEAQRQAAAALAELEAAASQALSPDEPHPRPGAIQRLGLADHRGRVWATRARPWVDRLASAWLIHRCIDPAGSILWLARPEDCPPQALGFDFDGATFSHVGARVSFETLLASFGLETPALQRLGAIVHFLDVGGVQPPEASGIERVLAGLRDAIADDDQLLATASAVFDGLLAAFEKDQPA